MEPESFRAFEHRGWERTILGYDNAFARLTCQAIEPLLAAAGVRAGDRLLDVATGPGYAAAAAAARGARVTAVDFSAAMVELARARNLQVEFREGDAEALKFPDDHFDAVVMNFGMLHLAQPERAMSEALRVLRPGGRFAFTVWAAPAQAVGFDIVLKAIQTRGEANVALPPGPPFFRFSDAAESRRVLLAAGFQDAAVKEIPQLWRFQTADGLFDAMVTGTVRTAALLRAQSREAIAAIGAAVREAAAAFERDGAVQIPMPAVVASAVKPG
ncbi:MAG: class I SAM-dependent methyltransferase [Burkholderiales bacterium]